MTTPKDDAWAEGLLKDDPDWQRDRAKHAIKQALVIDDLPNLEGFLIDHWDHLDALDRRIIRAVAERWLARLDATSGPRVVK